MIRVPAHVTVDFNNSDEHGRIFARLARASRDLEQGEVVLATDGEEHACQALVDEIEGELVYLELDWDTWLTIEITASTANMTPMTAVQPDFVSNGGADAESESAPIELLT